MEKEKLLILKKKLLKHDYNDEKKDPLDSER